MTLVFKQFYKYFLNQAGNFEENNYLEGMLESFQDCRNLCIVGSYHSGKTLLIDHLIRSQTIYRKDPEAPEEERGKHLFYDLRGVRVGSEEKRRSQSQSRPKAVKHQVKIWNWPHHLTQFTKLLRDIVWKSVGVEKSRKQHCFCRISCDLGIGSWAVAS